MLIHFITDKTKIALKNAKSPQKIPLKKAKFRGIFEFFFGGGGSWRNFCILWSEFFIF
jgi:hypothetical protein